LVCSLPTLRCTLIRYVRLVVAFAFRFVAFGSFTFGYVPCGWFGLRVRFCAFSLLRYAHGSFVRVSFVLVFFGCVLPFGSGWIFSLHFVRSFTVFLRLRSVTVMRTTYAPLRFRCTRCCRFMLLFAFCLFGLPRCCCLRFGLLVSSGCVARTFIVLR
jgi:hypothetical protein